jgi:hypothetical protein
LYNREISHTLLNYFSVTRALVLSCTKRFSHVFASENRTRNVLRVVTHSSHSITAKIAALVRSRPLVPRRRRSTYVVGEQRLEPSAHCLDRRTFVCRCVCNCLCQPCSAMLVDYRSGKRGKRERTRHATELKPYHDKTGSKLLPSAPSDDERFRSPAIAGSLDLPKEGACCQWQLTSSRVMENAHSLYAHNHSTILIPFLPREQLMGTHITSQ